MTARAVVLVASLTLLTPVPALAQTTPPDTPVPLRTRVRVTLDDANGARDGLRFVGALVAWDEATVTVYPRSGDAQVLRLDDVATIERSLGTKSNVGKGLLIGAGAGAALGLIITAAVGDTEASTGEVMAVFGGLGIGAGALTGALIGQASSGERWESVPFERPPRTSVSRR